MLVVQVSHLHGGGIIRRRVALAQQWLAIMAIINKRIIIRPFCIVRRGDARGFVKVNLLPPPSPSRVVGTSTASC